MKIIRPSFRVEVPRPFNRAAGIRMLKQIERIARTAYKSEDRITPNSYLAFVRDRLMGNPEDIHTACLEFGGMITVRFVCDRGVSHEIVRHRLCSFLQESTRYCDYSKGRFGGDIQLIHPPCLSPEQRRRREDLFWAIQSVYNLEISEGLGAQIARGVLPTALKTEINVGANPTEWRHIFRKRIPKKAHPQMRELMIPLLEQFKAAIPVLFDDIKL